MKRTQLYLDEAMAKKLAALSRQRGTTISNLVRESIRETLMNTKSLDKSVLARQLSGVWASRRDLFPVEATIRRLRRGKRLKRLTIGRNSA